MKRNLAVQMETETTNKKMDSENYVEGYASTFDTYELCKDYDGNPIYERFERNAFDSADMSDTVLQFDHGGFVCARVSNGTLALSIDDGGLHVAADLSKTTRSRMLYEDIKERNINAMSIKCSVESDFDIETNTHIVRKVNRVYDVSAVSFPANDNTAIVARKKDMVKDIENKKNEKLKTLVEIKLKLGEV